MWHLGNRIEKRHNTHMKYILSLLVGLSISTFADSVSAQSKQPNIVLIMADDIGQGDIGFYHTDYTGKKPVIPTPNIDKLAREGMIFTDAHSPSSLCAPTRFSMMTGNYAFRNEQANWGAWGSKKYQRFDDAYTTIGRIAQQGGYTTAFFGKWGMEGLMEGYPKEYSGFEQTTLGPEYYGFNYSYWMPDGIQFHPYLHYENSQWVKLKPDSKIVKVSFELTKYPESWRERDREGPGDSNWDPTIVGPILAEKAVGFIDRQKNTNKPFFIYYCSQAVHEPHNPPAKLGETTIAGKTPSAHGDMIWELDVQVGELVKALKKNGMFENTLFVFTSDNGGLKGSEFDHTPGHDTSNGWTGNKSLIWEGGHRVPFIAVWPGHIAPGSKSQVSIVGHDMVATVAALAQVPTEGLNLQDSKNLLPTLTMSNDQPVHDYLIHRASKGKDFYYAIRMGDWKLIAQTKGKDKWETLYPTGLYNLKQNRQETEKTNLMGKAGNTQRVDDMMKKLKEILSR